MIEERTINGILTFADEHEGDDVVRLLLQKERYPDMDLRFAVQQIEGRRVAAEKWPGLAAHRSYLFPPKLNREQSSSEATAKLKGRIAERVMALQQCCKTSNGSVVRHLADLTGGMGVDSLALATIMDGAVEVDYVEMDAELCSLMEYNCGTLGVKNIRVHQAESMHWLEDRTEVYDLIYIDPARRDRKGRKVTAFEDCTPNILEHLRLLSKHCRWLMVKASPMTDIHAGLEELGGVVEVHVVAVKGECKELLFVCGASEGEARIVCHNLWNGYDEAFAFSFSEEATASVGFAKAMDYIYEPNAAVMKAGAFRLVGEKWGVAKLSQNTHLYTGERLLEDFPGRQFRVLQALKMCRKAMHEVLPEGKAHVMTRNYPISAEELQKKLGLKEGGELFVVATREGSWLCEKALIARRE